MSTQYKIHTDGGSRGNPGQAAIGVVIEVGFGSGEKKEYAESIGVATNNEAEYSAVIFALKKIKQLAGGEKASQAHLVFYIDSELIVKQLNYEYRVKDEDIQKFFIEIHNLRFDFKTIEFNHVPREQNLDADRLVNQALDLDDSRLRL